MNDEIIYRGSGVNPDNNSMSSASTSSASVPESDEAIDETEEVQRAISAAAIRSGDSPPPPETKLLGAGSKNISHNNNNSSSAAAAPGSSGKRRNSTNNISAAGPTRFQFYVPTTDYAAIGGSSNAAALVDSGALPDPPSAAEESARRARSRLIKLQNNMKQSFSGSGGAGITADAVQEINKNDQEEEADDYSQINFDPIESDDEIDPKDLNANDDEDSTYGDYDEQPKSPQQLMKKIHEGRGTSGRSKSNQRTSSHNNSANSRGAKYKQTNHHHHHQQQQLHHSSPQLFAKQSPRRKSKDLFSDGIDLLETAANEARERDEVDTLNGSITYLRNLQLNADTTTTNVTTMTTTPRKATPLPPPPPPQPQPSISDPRSQYVPTTNMDNADDIIQARSSRIEEDSKTAIITSMNQNHHDDHHSYHRSKKQPQYRQAKSVPSTPVNNKRNRPKITAAEAMDYVMNASSARVQKYNEDNNNDDYDNEGDKAVDRMKAFFNAISRSDEVALADDDNIDEMEVLASRSGSILQNDFEDSGDEIINDDFEQNTSLSMHAEVKSPSTTSRYVLNKHEAIADSAKNQLDRAQFDNRQNSLLLDEHHSDTTSSRRTSSIDPPDLDEFGSTSINPSVLPLKTMNERLYGVEAVIPSSSFEQGISRQTSKETRAPATALGPRSKRPGGITGVVLDVRSNDSEKYGTHVAKERTTTNSIYGGSRNRGLDPQDTVVEKRSQSETERLLSREDFGDGQSISQMMSLCSHLLPIGFNSFFRNDNANDVNLSWDDDDPDDPGYIVHRLTDSELMNVENTFEKMVNSFEQSSANKVRTGASDRNFERDLEEAEMILDQEEERYNAEIQAARYSAAATSSEDDSDVSSKSDDASSQLERSPSHAYIDAENEDRTSVPGFPGIFSPGQGRVGEMECFYLPVITKSQKTGFEPTKDLVLKPGSVFANNYLVQSELGSAAFSTAYRCIDLSSEEDDEGYQDEVCLKVIKNTKDYFDQSLDEIKILQLLKDTGRVQENNIVEMKSFFYHREHLVIVTELLRQNLYEFGKSIRESRGPTYFTRQRLSHITRQCLIALKFVHELGLMHCDIKPENILLGSYSRALVKVIDFGSSSFVTDRQSSYIQSRSYRAPEVILGLPYGGKIDMWSLGCVLAEMYTGEVTFQNDSEVSMLSRIEAICGPFPRHMIAKGRNSHRIFTDSGLIYEKVSGRDAEESGSRSGSDDGAEEDLFDIYQPKMTTIAARLGFDADFLDKPKLSEGDEMRALFIDFVSKLLTIDPDLRPTAEDALQHPWIVSSLDLTEDDIRYPPDV
ncbi:hypothetical protein ACHAWT_003095 [Skeletonema menzelii]